MPSADIPSDPPAGHPSDLQRPLDESVPVPDVPVPEPAATDVPAPGLPAPDVPPVPAQLRPAAPATADQAARTPAGTEIAPTDRTEDAPPDGGADPEDALADGGADPEDAPVAAGAGVATHAAPPAGPVPAAVGAVLRMVGRAALAPVRALRRLVGRSRRALVAWSRRPAGRLVLPALLMVALLGAAGAGGGLLVPSMGTAGGSGPEPGTTGPVPTGSAGLPVAPTGAPPVGPTVGPGPIDQRGSRADALQGWSEQMSERTGISAVALQAYGYAELVVARTTPGCQLSWTTLAAIGRVESNHGRSGGATLLPDGRALPPIIGAQLDGQGARALIPDTDGGELDGDPDYDRAVGPMQFIPQTWRREAVDATGDGVADIHNINDAALAAANYLCRHGRDLTSPNGWWTAILAYNNVQSYAEAVFAAANEYGQRSRT